MMWCYCYHHRVWKILREFTYEDDFNNTLLKTCPSETLLCLGIVTKLVKKCDIISIR